MPDRCLLSAVVREVFFGGECRLDKVARHSVGAFAMLETFIMLSMTVFPIGDAYVTCPPAKCQ